MARRPPQPSTPRPPAHRRTQRPARRARRVQLLAVFALLLLIGGVAGWQWLKRHPQHNPYAPFSLAHPIGWATGGKIAAMGDDPARCFAVLDAAGIAVERLPPMGTGACHADARGRLSGSVPGLVPLRPAGAAPSCAVQIGLILWQRKVVQPAARQHLGMAVVGIEHMGTYNCRSIAGSSTPSEHATGNAIDISAFILADGRRVTLLDHWDAPDGRSAFLKAVRDGSCPLFSTVLSPDYNRAHANHFHFDQAQRSGGWRVCA